MERKLDQILAKLEKLEKIESDIEELKALKPKIEESHQWLSILVEAKEVHKAEIHQMGNKIDIITGVLTGFNNSLEPIHKLKKAE